MFPTARSRVRAYFCIARVCALPGQASMLSVLFATAIVVTTLTTALCGKSSCRMSAAGTEPITFHLNPNEFAAGAKFPEHGEVEGRSPS